MKGPVKLLMETGFELFPTAPLEEQNKKTPKKDQSTVQMKEPISRCSFVGDILDQCMAGLSDTELSGMKALFVEETAGM
jgi:hypothetical protein